MSAFDPMIGNNHDRSRLLWVDIRSMTSGGLARKGPALTFKPLSHVLDLHPGKHYTSAGSLVPIGAS